MFEQKNRLRHEKDVKLTLKKGRSVFDSVCGVKFRPNGGTDSRFAVVVGIKVHKSAVKRNRVRRQYREIIRTNLTGIKPGMDVMLLTSKGALDLDYDAKKERLMGVLKKAKLVV
ncbi:ribonuclease P protein component [Candidatus Uhrbacteria bacterium]|jgi:ribonuclease P protein component|nr:ribonuclease P protein component [Candidatus Uhrbacteria bacterium]